MLSHKINGLHKGLSHETIYPPRKTLAILAFGLASLSINAHADPVPPEIVILGVRVPLEYKQGIEMYLQGRMNQAGAEVTPTDGVLTQAAMNVKMKQEMMKVLEKCLAIQTAIAREKNNLKADLKQNLDDWMNRTETRLATLNASQEACATNAPAAVKLALDFTAKIKGDELSAKLAEWSSLAGKETVEGCQARARGIYDLAAVANTAYRDKVETRIKDDLAALPAFPKACSDLGFN